MIRVSHGETFINIITNRRKRKLINMKVSSFAFFRNCTELEKPCKLLHLAQGRPTLVSGAENFARKEGRHRVMKPQNC